MWLNPLQHPFYTKLTIFQRIYAWCKEMIFGDAPEQPEPIELSDVDFREIQQACEEWFTSELAWSFAVDPHNAKFSPFELWKAQRDKPLFNICGYNLLNIDTFDRTFAITDSDRTVSRLWQVYVQLASRLGRGRIRKLEIELLTSLRNIPFTYNKGEDYAELLKHNPYIILIPTLNSIVNRFLSTPSVPSQ